MAANEYRGNPTAGVTEAFNYFTTQQDQWQKHRCAWLLRQDAVRREFLENGATYYVGSDMLQHKCEPAQPVSEERKILLGLDANLFLNLPVRVSKFYDINDRDVIQEGTLSAVLEVTADGLLRDAHLYRYYLLSQEAGVAITVVAAKALKNKFALPEDKDTITAVLKEAETSCQSRNPSDRVVRDVARRLAHQRELAREQVQEQPRQADGRPTGSGGLGLPVAMQGQRGPPGLQRQHPQQPQGRVTADAAAAAAAGAAAAAAADAAAAALPTVRAANGTRGHTPHQSPEQHQAAAVAAAAAAAAAAAGRRTRDPASGAAAGQATPPPDAAAAANRRRTRGQQQQEQDEEQPGEERGPARQRLRAGAAAAARVAPGAQPGAVGAPGSALGSDGAAAGDALLELAAPGAANRSHEISSAGSNRSTDRNEHQPLPPGRRLPQRHQQPREQRVTAAAAAGQLGQRQQRRTQDRPRARAQDSGQQQRQLTAEEALAAERDELKICRFSDFVRLRADSVQALGDHLDRVLSQWLARDKDCWVVESSTNISPELRQQLDSERVTLLALDCLPVPAAPPQLPEGYGLHYMAHQISHVRPLPNKWPLDEIDKADHLLRLMVGNVVLAQRETMLDLPHLGLQSDIVALDTGLLIEYPIRRTFGWLDQEAEPWIQIQALDG